MNKPIRILHVIGIMNRGGAETFIMNVYRKIDKKKYQFDFVVHSNEEGAYDNEIRALGGIIYRTKKFNVVNYLSYSRWWKEFFNKHNEYRIVHGHINSSAAIYLNLSKRYGLYTIVHSHATKNVDPGLRKYVFNLFAYPIRFIADFYIGCSKQAGEDRFGKDITSNTNKFCVLKNGINIEQFQFDQDIRKKVRKELESRDNIVLGHVGRFVRVKNHKRIIEIYKLLKKNNYNVELWLIGSGELEQEIKDQAKSIEGIYFLGEKDSVSDYLMGMDYFIFPSFYEGLGISLIEAEATGLRCLVSDAIQDEAIVISDNVKRLSVERKAEYWAKELQADINTYHNNNRKDCCYKVSQAGYDISETVKKLEELYMRGFQA